MVSGAVSCEVIIGGAGARLSLTTILAHLLAAAYFVTWAALYGVLLHWRTSMNAWVLAFVAAGTGFLVIVATFAVASNFAASNITTSLEHGHQHYMSGLIHVGMIMESSFVFFAAILVPSALQLGFLGLNETCCTWSGVETTQFVVTYLISLLYYHFAIAHAIRLLYADLRPVFQVPDVFTKTSD